LKPCTLLLAPSSPAALNAPDVNSGFQLSSIYTPAEMHPTGKTDREG
jgi:hypothetical protein